MHRSTGDYTDWQSIDYHPAIAELEPRTLLQYLSMGQSVLDVGCNSGGSALFLARKGLRVTGIDLNPKAIDIARDRAERAGFGYAAQFIVGDVIRWDYSGLFDVVTMIRLLTCFPAEEGWRALLSRANSLIKPGGRIYINDFVMAQDNRQYRDRYDAAARLGWREGKFAVNDAEGNLRFIAHHHTEQEMGEIFQPYEKLQLTFQESTSMNGNQCSMFEFIGQKNESPVVSRFRSRNN